jgi:6-phosphogluconolactonase
MKRLARALGPLCIFAGSWACDSGDGAGSRSLAGAASGVGGALAAGGAGAAAGGSGGAPARGGSSGSVGNLPEGLGGALANVGGSAGRAGASGRAGAGSEPARPAHERAFVYVGTYENAIYVFALDTDSGVLTPQGGAVSAAPSPSFLAFAPDGAHLYAVNEADDVDGTGAGAVSAFELDPATGGLRFINRVSSGGAGPAHVAVDATGKFVLVANYNGGNFSVLSVNAAGGLGARVSGGEHGKGAQTHEVVLDPSNQFLFVANKGRSDVSQYRFDAESGSVTQNTPADLDLAAGAGTRHLAFHPTLPFVYIINELDDSLSVASFSRSAGTLTPIQTLSTLPAGANGAQNSCAEVQVAPSGRFVYASNRGHDSLAIFSVDAGSGRVALVGHQATGGATPRSFNIDKSGRILLVANQGANEVVSFRVDTATGLLMELASVSVPAPAFVGVRYLPAP